jgi:hypothetical protein
MSKSVLFSMCFIEGIENVLASMHVGMDGEKTDKVPVLRIEYIDRDQVINSMNEAINLMLDKYEEKTDVEV